MQSATEFQRTKFGSRSSTCWMKKQIDTLCSTSPSVDWVIASDMIYDELLTESFCYVRLPICCESQVMASSLRHFDCYCLLSGEHRFNFLASSLSTVDYVLSGWDCDSQEFGVFKQFVCFKEACWNAYSREGSARPSTRRRCDCGCLLLAKPLLQQQNDYILLLSSVY
mgnify:CR=1 FL=1